ncbi:MAG TPA: hypothetical protein DCM38_02425 [Gammaproteobacteria bacterium]|nr:hypothetical protein [Gammaproteobacteria bacterium]
MPLYPVFPQNKVLYELCLKLVLDTETTCIETSQSHRIIEIGYVEIPNQHITDL